MAFGSGGTPGADDYAAFYAMMALILANPSYYRADNVAEWKDQVAAAAYELSAAMAAVP